MKKVLAHRALEDCVYKLRAKVKDYNVRLSLIKIGLTVKDLEDLENKVEETSEWLDDNPDAEKGELQDKKTDLYNICRQKKLHCAGKAVLKDAEYATIAFDFVQQEDDGDQFLC
ncbi:hypothetical protein L2E82_32763 [Cichorium intybus]|uniref:Uncharacterized protein n=1 Tax=Cichorium intybus TaxID=13427 RepID=A0ACB9BHQ0_CICIN|nr:hypothetical protein L2E82_32763 [Cichorium intybus]